MIARKEQNPEAWDEARDVVVECLLDLLRIKTEDQEKSQGES